MENWGNTHIRSFYTSNLFNYVPPVFARRIHVCVINPTKASGSDLINPRLLKEAASIIKHPLYKLFNLSLRVASYPSQWKKANITPVFTATRSFKTYRGIRCFTTS
jgi:hypothetical protein